MMSSPARNAMNVNDTNKHQAAKRPKSKNLPRMHSCTHDFKQNVFLSTFVWLSFLCGSICAQTCSCSPSVYKMTFDFGLKCPPVNITRNGGVETSYCQISGYGGPDDMITDRVPVSVISSCCIHSNT
eukprot:scaffold22766_cov131-Cylindrotheca_fusiformis.AAC.4